jgi:hypothetical protein
MTASRARVRATPGHLGQVGHVPPATYAVLALLAHMPIRLARAPTRVSAARELQSYGAPEPEPNDGRQR